MANYEGRDFEIQNDHAQELAIDLTDPNSVAENMDLLSEEQIEDLLAKARDLNKQLKGTLSTKERQNQHQKSTQVDVRSKNLNPFLPPIKSKGNSLVGKI